jgi:hypothetical protein
MPAFPLLQQYYYLFSSEIDGARLAAICFEIRAEGYIDDLCSVLLLHGSRSGARLQQRIFFSDPVAHSVGIFFSLG